MDLQRLRSLMRQAEIAQGAIEWAEARATRITKFPDFLPHSTNNTGSALEEHSIELIEAKEALQAIREQLAAAREELESAIQAAGERLKPDERAFLRLRYIYGYKLKDIVYVHDISERQGYYIMKRAEKTIAETYSRDL